MQLLLSDLGALNLQGQPNFNLLLIWTWLQNTQRSKVSYFCALKRVWSHPDADLSQSRGNVISGATSGRFCKAPSHWWMERWWWRSSSRSSPGLLRNRGLGHSCRSYQDILQKMISNRKSSYFEIGQCFCLFLLLLFQRKCLVYFSLNDHMNPYSYILI